MKFSEFKYERPNLEAFKKEVEGYIAMIGEGKTLQEEITAIENVFKLNDQMFTQASLVGVRNSIDTTDDFYEKEQEFFDENLPHLQQYEHTFTAKLLLSKHRKDLEQ